MRRRIKLTGAELEEYRQKEKVTAINESLFLFNKPSKIMAFDSSVVKTFNHVLVII